MRVVFAVETASVPMPGGGTMPVRKGAHWPADDPLVRAHPDLFSEDPRYGLTFSAQPADDPPLEQMTAAPGERRQTRRG